MKSSQPKTKDDRLHKILDATAAPRIVKRVSFKTAPQYKSYTKAFRRTGYGQFLAGLYPAVSASSRL
jgi:hypothetical protein